MQIWKKAGNLALMLVAGLLGSGSIAAQESVCARVKIEIRQELTLERQAFDAEMRITNSLPATPLTDILVDVRVTDELGQAVTVTTDPNNLSAQFFLRQTQKQGIENTSGTGQVAASSTATINWLLIPAPGAAGNSPFGKRYLVGASLRYKFGGETNVMELNPDAITVKPLPMLTLDYFLTRDVIADDPFTQAVEAPEPYTLGVRVKNTGIGAAKALKINSAQPRIVENQQGLPITFVILGSYVQDTPATNSLLIPFGDIASGTSKMGRWQMQSNLSGTFVDFTASFTHSDELGGALTSLLQATNAHLLLRDVRVDLPGRDMVRDFLAYEGTDLRLYESEGGQDSPVTDRSGEAVLTTSGNGYRLSLPPSMGYFYVRKPDPFGGQKLLGPVLRADAKAMAAENVWLSKSKNPQTQQWEHWVNFFDANSPGVYELAFREADSIPGPPVLQFIPDRVVKEGEQVGFLVEASSPAHKHLTLSAEPLPTGATFFDQGDGTAVFDWTPGTGTDGDYVIHYLASDGSQSATRSARIRVEAVETPVDPAAPQLVAPLAGAEIQALRPQFKVLTGEASNDPTQAVQFELYDNGNWTLPIETATRPENPASGEPTVWTIAQDLNDNTHYWWRVRAVAANDVYSAWVEGSFFANLANDPPNSFNLTTPSSNIEIDSVKPTLTLTNAVDRDGDAITYSFEVFADAAMTQRVAFVDGLEPGADGSTSWTLPEPLTNHATYWWRAIASDEPDAQTMTPLRAFTVNTGNHAPSAPTPVSPVGGIDVTTAGSAQLFAQGSTDDEHDALTFEFEIDTVATFDSSNRRTSGPLAAANGAAGWPVAGLLENQRYYWRVRASDGRAESEWAGGDFRMDAANEAPSVPGVANPSNGAWVGTQYPTLQAHAATDPEDDVLHYHFEVYRDAGLQNREGYATVDALQWQVGSALTDKAAHYWRVRAEDPSGAVSAWSATTKLTVSTGTYVDPTIALVAPATIVDARRGVPSVQWNGTDPNTEPTIALYYDQTGSGYTGNRIVDGLRQDAGTQSGSYAWNVSALAPGAYYVYGVIYDDRGLGHAYAPGTVVVPASPQLGSVQATARTTLTLKEGRDTGSVQVSLSRAPTADVVVPLTSSDTTEATITPNQLVFTPTNWSSPQLATVLAVADGIKDGDQPYTISVGDVVSRDPHYISVAATPLTGVVVDQNLNANTGVAITSLQLTSKQRDRRTGTWEYRYKAQLTNNGAQVKGVTADVATAAGFTIVTGRLIYGTVDQNESVLSDKEIVLQSPNDIGTALPTLTWTLKVK
jgi:hypothetical protein